MATVKSLRSAKPRYCTVLDVCTLFPKIVTEQINLDQSDSPIVLYGYQIDSFIASASQEIYANLSTIYTSANLAVTPYVGAIISDGTNNSRTSRLVAAAAGTSAICEHFTLTFSSSTGYTASGFLSGSVGTGSTTTDFTSSGDGDLIIQASSVTGMFSGTFTSGDTIFVAVNKWHDLIASTAVYLATANILKSLAFSNQISIDPAIYERYGNHAKGIIQKLQKPDAPDGLVLPTLPDRNFKDINLGDWENDLYDDFGNPNPNYFSNDDIETYQS